MNFFIQSLSIYIGGLGGKVHTIPELGLFALGILPLVLEALQGWEDLYWLEPGAPSSLLLLPFFPKKCWNQTNTFPKSVPNFEYSIIHNILASPTTWATIRRLFLLLTIWDSQSLKLPALWSNPSQSQNNAWTPNRSRKARVGQDVLKGIAASTIPLSHKLAFAP